MNYSSAAGGGMERIMYSDKTIKCKECGEEFVFTAGEQEFYAQRGFDSEPRRCRKCRERGKHESRNKQDRIAYEIVCSRCGKVESVYFEPRHDKAVYCSECYKEINARR